MGTQYFLYNIKQSGTSYCWGSVPPPPCVRHVVQWVLQIGRVEADDTKRVDRAYDDNEMLHDVGGVDAQFAVDRAELLAQHLVQPGTQQLLRPPPCINVFYFYEASWGSRTTDSYLAASGNACRSHMPIMKACKLANGAGNTFF